MIRTGGNEIDRECFAIFTMDTGRGEFSMGPVVDAPTLDSARLRAKAFLYFRGFPMLRWPALGQANLMDAWRRFTRLEQEQGRNPAWYV